MHCFPSLIDCVELLAVVSHFCLCCSLPIFSHSPVCFTAMEKWTIWREQAELFICHFYDILSWVKFNKLAISCVFCNSRSLFCKDLVFFWLLLQHLCIFYSHCLHCLVCWDSTMEASEEEISSLVRYPGASHMFRNRCCCRRRNEDLCLPSVSTWNC